MLETKFQAHKKEQAKLQFCVSWSLYFWIAKWRQKILHRTIASIPWSITKWMFVNWKTCVDMPKFIIHIYTNICFRSSQQKALKVLLARYIVYIVYFNYLDSMITNDARCTREIKSRIAMAKAALNKKRTLFTSILDTNLRKKKVLHSEHSCVWCSNVDTSESRS
jgi:hypothetical protein